MLKTCLKCGHQADVGSEITAACPACGAIYAKLEQLPTAQRQALRAASAPKAAAADRPAKTPLGERILWALTGIGAVLGFVQIAMTHFAAQSAPQQAAGFALAMAYAVVPYVLARAAQEFRR
jgi:hypothetical protein